MSVSWYTYPTLWRFERIFDDAIPEIVVTLYRYSGRFGRNGYERLRARAIVLTMRYTGLRIGDVAMLAKNRVSHDGARWRIFLHTEKTGKPVFLPIADELRLALNVVPNPPTLNAPQAGNDVEQGIPPVHQTALAHQRGLSAGRGETSCWIAPRDNGRSAARHLYADNYCIIK